MSAGWAQFAGSGTQAEQVAFLQEVIPWLESQSFIERYAALYVPVPSSFALHSVLCALWCVLMRLRARPTERAAARSKACLSTTTARSLPSARRTATPSSLSLSLANIRELSLSAARSLARVDPVAVGEL